MEFDVADRNQLPMRSFFSSGRATKRLGVPAPSVRKPVLRIFKGSFLVFCGDAGGLLSQCEW